MIQCGMEQLVARRAHNPKVVSSSLAPATQGRIKLKAKSVKLKAKSREQAFTFHLVSF